MFFFPSQMQRVFIVEHNLASRTYSTSQNEFMDTVKDSHMPNKSTVSRLGSHFYDAGHLHRFASDMTKECINASLNAVDFSNA